MTDSVLSSLSPEILAALQREHVAFFEARLVSETARQDWLASFRQGYAWFLGLPVRDVVDPVALTEGVVHALTAESVKAVFAPVARDIHRRVLAALRADASRLGDYVPAKARLAIDELLERSDLVPEHLVRNVLEQEAIEDLVRDILYDGLVEFNETANPFFADWGLPALVKRMPIGGGAILKSMGAMRSEFDKRLEPEIRKFLQAFSRKASGKLADLFMKKGDDPKFIALRKSVVSFLYAQSMKELLVGVDEKAAAGAETAAEHIALETLRREEPRQKLRAALETFLAEQGDRTVGQWLAAAGAQGEPDLDAWATLAWPHLKRLLESPVARGFFEKLAAEFYGGLGKQT
ncbi:MAG: hypothetical protein JWP97_3396 [Labilithrix sp.]|nr:hypothetical protein [Labilithrix sp.]